MEKTFTIVGVSTLNKTVKFRVANGDIAARIKILNRCDHTAVNLIRLDHPMTKMAAIAEFKLQFPDAVEVRMPNDTDELAKTIKAKTVNIKGAAGRKVTDAATELLRAVEED